MSDDYHLQYSHISKTMLGHFATSVEDYWHYYIRQDMAPPAPKRQMVIGSAVHEILLEKANPAERIAVYPDTCFKSNGHKNPKPCAEFEDENYGRFVLKEADATIVRRACDAVLNHELGKLVRHPEAVFEQAIHWTCERTGMGCRCKPDFYIDMGDRILAYDLKTTETIYPGSFAKTAKMFRYWLQDAHYSAGLRATFGKPVEFRFWCVEVKEPYRISPREYDSRSREIADQAYGQMMDRLADCYKRDVWRDEWTTKVTHLTLGPWDVDLHEPELEGFDDE